VAYMITDQCISCGACFMECPWDAIGVEDSKFFIDPEKCSECIGNYDEPKCKSVCPVDDAIILNNIYSDFNEDLSSNINSIFMN